MKPTSNPLFTNTCGKIYRDRIVLASSRREEIVQREELSGITIKSRIALKELLFASFPAVLLILPLFLTPKDLLLKIVFIATGIAGTGLMLYKAKRSYILTVSLKNGRSKRRGVHAYNIMDARKFAKEVDKMIHSGQQKSPEHTNRAVKAYTAEA